LDEQLPPTISEQLRQRGVDAVSVHELGLRGASDEYHLEQALQMGRVLVTMDEDFLTIASRSLEHLGIIYGRQRADAIGEWVKQLALIASV
jgi:predicted nuclease of predicted toxin-antitoxin system